MRRSAPPSSRSAAELPAQLRRAILRLSRELRRESQRVGVSALDAQLLAIMKKRPGLGVSELADLEQITKPAMSAHVKRLEEAAWIAREEVGEDKRRFGLVLTAAGERALQDIRRLRNDWLAARMESLSPEETQALAAALPVLEALFEGERS